MYNLQFHSIAYASSCYMLLTLFRIIVYSNFVLNQISSDLTKFIENASTSRALKSFHEKCFIRAFI